MEYLIVVLKILIATAILNVWLLRSGRSSPYRGGNAQNLKQEFLAYGLPLWLMYLVGFLKVALAGLLIISIWYPQLTLPAALGLSILLLGAIVAHIRLKDPLKKSMPATALLLCTIVVLVI